MGTGGSRRAGWLLAIGMAASASAALAAPAVIEDRIANFRDIGSAFKNIGDELKTGRPKPVRVRSAAKTVRDYSRHVPAWFPPGSRPPPPVDEGFVERIRNWLTPDDDTGAVKSHAKPEIWTRPAEFRRAAVDFQVAAERLYDASLKGDAAAVAAQYRATGATCQRCHDRFREKLK